MRGILEPIQWLRLTELVHVSAHAMNSFESKKVNIMFLPKIRIYLGENIFIHCSRITEAHVDVNIVV